MSAEAEAIIKQVYSEMPNYDIIIPALLEHGIDNVHKHAALTAGVLLHHAARPAPNATIADGVLRADHAAARRHTAGVDDEAHPAVA